MGINMSKFELLQMMERSKTEIRRLQAEVARLAPRAEAFDALQSVLNLMPGRGESYTEDWAWKLEQRIKELEEEDLPPEPEVET